ncbi:glycosyltransferase family 4 protein [archaeon]|nr:glycosyltransferase family 4 protein [archaeon]NCP78955.1 glycosyltransferase family 4 protein [archaeon]NCP97662.1 glycosyltransferase family 4 protein [archaeon]NCQ06722.1 glycosyltransferase family 4 protein [archaeon]NCQ50518.1 glycosyltransferase family 4 protein [archaeon]
MFKDKNLLIISNGYPNKEGSIDCTFVKTQVDELSKYFKKVYVIVPTPYFSIFLSKFVKGYKNRLNNKNYCYKNIEVYYTTYFKLPNKISYKTFNLFDSVDSVIKKNNLKFDLMHAHFTYPSGYVASKLKEKYGIKLIVTGHGFDVYDFPFRNKNNKSKFIYTLNNCDYFITVSKKNMNKVNSIVDVKDKYKIIPNGIPNYFKNTSQVIARKKLKLPLNKKIILHVGNYIVDIKNQINLIKAINELSKVRGDFVLYLIGSGKDEFKIKQEIIKLNLTKYIKVVGSKSHNEIPIWMSASDLFVLPSYFEGNPTVMLEALTCGCPFLGSSAGGMEEIIFPDIGIILDDPYNFNKLFFLINYGLNKKWEYKKIMKYSKNYYISKINIAILKIYSFIVSK